MTWTNSYTKKPQYIRFYATIVYIVIVYTIIVMRILIMHHLNDSVLKK
jgi:hypothetical protein